jgi:hypothetical protein
MDHVEVPLTACGNNQPVPGLPPELSEADLECVVGGLARPWTESDPDLWLLEPVKSAL